MNPLYRPELVNEPKFKAESIKDASLSTNDKTVLKSQEWLIREGVHKPYLTKIEKTALSIQERDAVKKAKFESKVKARELRKQIIDVIINLNCNFNGLKLTVIGDKSKNQSTMVFVA